MHSVILPNFFIIGAQKAGTTSLYSYLDQHPQVFMSPLKEPSFFAPEQCRAGFQFSWEAYLNLFGNVTDEVAIGEATATYLWSHTAAVNIAARIPRAKIIVSLRNPIERAYSQYLHMLTEGVTRISFRDQVRESLRSNDHEFGLLWPFLEQGHYTEQLNRYFAQFPRSQMHIFFYEDLETRPKQILRELLSFLGVDPGFPTDLTHRYNAPRVPRFASATYWLKRSGAWPLLRSFSPPALRPRLASLLIRSRHSMTIEPADRAYLADYYRDEVGRLSALLGRDLSGWLGGEG